MLSLLWTIPAYPLAGFLALTLFGDRITRRAAAIIGAGSVGLSAAVTLIVGADFVLGPPEGHTFTQTLWTWISAGDFLVDVALQLDALSMVMVFVVTVIGFLIHVYSTEYMADDASFARFFAYMNLFVAAMLTLVLADNLLVLFVGWEGVGLCSYLLIGFWYEDPKNGRAATKAFLVTRVGDAAMFAGMLLLFWQFHSLDIPAILQGVVAGIPSEDGLREIEPWVMTLAAALLLGGALGKSGQLPLQVWLPDAMAGPTPVSALIHAATMVTAGVYLIARMHPIFEHAPGVQFAVALIGLVTLLFAGACALVQRDIKRVLAYSTISQIGYMFLALGVGAWSAAMFHFFTHAIFKALLFMAAGAVIVALHHEQDLFKMGGLRYRLPRVYWTFLIGAISLAALPLVTAGFYSKDMILYHVYTSDRAGHWLWAGGVLGAFITALYTFRMLFLAFFGKAKAPIHHQPGPAMIWPLIALAAAATLAGFLEVPPVLGDIPIFSDFLEHAMPAVAAEHASLRTEFMLMAASTFAVALGIGLAYFTWYPGRKFGDAFSQSRLGTSIRRPLEAGWGFDALYDRLVVRPYSAGARANATDAVDIAYAQLAERTQDAADFVRRSQNGRLRWYMAGVALGAILSILLSVYT